MHFGLNNPYNYVRVSELQPVSIETLAILVTAGYLLYLVHQKRCSLEIAYFLALPFSDEPFRIADSVQPVEVISLLLIALNYRKIRFNYVILMGGVFILFALVGFGTGSVHGAYPLLYSLRFLLTGFTFSILVKREFSLPASTVRFAVLFCFAMTFLQIFLWTAGLPIHGVFFNGIIPRAKGLAHEPGTWAIWIVTLFAFIYYFNLGRFYVWLNVINLLMTFSTFGVIAFLSFLLLRWGLQGFQFRLKRRVLVSAASILGIGLVVFSLQSNASESVANTLSLFNKLAFYQQEFVRFASGGSASEGEDSVDLSGRGRDFTYFQNYFPPNWVVGIGSWNTDVNVNGAATNTYLVMPVEIGAIGSSLIVMLMLLHFSVLLRNKDRKSVDFLAASLNFLLMIAGIRCFAFHELWYTQVLLLRTAEGHEAENVSLKRNNNADASRLSEVSG